MHYWITFFALIIASASAASPSVTKQYRDYVYNKKTDAFYKLHIEGTQPWRARSLCVSEGAALMMPESHADLVQAHSLFKRFPDLGNYLLVDSDGRAHESVEEPTMFHFSDVPSSVRPSGMEVDVMTRKGDVESYYGYDALPFICKIAARDAPYNAECDVYSSDYVNKVSTTGSCYRIAREVANWNEAYAFCQADGGHLAILNNQGEVEVVKQLLQNFPQTTSRYDTWQFFVGIRAEKTEPRIFKTVMNQTLDEVGFQPWAENEPNNEFGVEYCVSVLRSSGLYNDTVCRNRYSYLCEKERRV